MDKLQSIQALLTKFSVCTLCNDMTLHRNTVVFGTGNINADLMIIGEAPGEKEDESGYPIADSAAELLQSALTEAGVKVKDVYVTNMVLCRPVSIEQGKTKPYKKDRDATRTELEACRARLNQEIYTVDPKLILLLGPKAATLVTHLSMQNIIGTFQRVKIPGKTEKTVLSYPAISTFHPTQVIRAGDDRTTGTHAERFYSHVQLAARMLRVARELPSK